MVDPDIDDDADTASGLTNPRIQLGVGDWLRERFELTAPLDDGALGGSFLGRDVTTGHGVVATLISSQLLVNDGERKDFAQKLEMFAGRALAGCVMPLDVVTGVGFVAVVSPRVDAVSLRDVLAARARRGERLAIEEALRVCLSLVSALQAMHTASPHGGLRPENVLLSAKGLLLAECIVGISVAPDRLYTRLGAHSPTALSYTAPEVASGRRPTASADLFALGAIATELVGGAPPDRGPDLSAMPVELRKAISVLLDREPGRRPAGVRMLVDALVSAAGLAARPPEPPLPLPLALSLHADVAAPAQVTAELVADPTMAVALPPPEPVVDAPPADEPPADELTEPKGIDAVTAVAVAPKARPAPLVDPSTDVVVPLPDAPVRVGPGRLSSATASLPLMSRGPAPASGPPADLRVRSGPPLGASPTSSDEAPTARRPGGPPPSNPPPKLPPKYARTQAPTVRTAPLTGEGSPPSMGPVRSSRPPPSAGSATSPLPPPRVSLQPAARPSSPAPPSQRPDKTLRDDDPIDPSLLRAARMLDAERKRPERPVTLHEADVLEDS